VGRERYRQWQERYGRENEHNRFIPRDTQLLPQERQKIIEFYKNNSLEGYRRLTYMMIDTDLVCVAPTTTYRVLIDAGLLKSRHKKPSKKGRGFHQPDAPHCHWHIDITYIKIKGIYYYLILVLDGYSRFIVAWDLRERMTEADVEIVVQKGKELFPEARPRLISDNGSQFVAKEFKIFMTHVGMTHTTTSPYYPQSNGKLERCNKTIKAFLRTMFIADFKDGLRLVDNFIHYYNTVRLHSSIVYVAPSHRLSGDDKHILLRREQKLEEARALRKMLRERSSSQELKKPLDFYAIL